MSEQTIDSSVSYHLADGYKMTKVTGKEGALILRDKNENVVAIINTCNNKIINVRGFKDTPLRAKVKKLLCRFVKAQHYNLCADAAADLDLSILRQGDNPEIYLTEAEVSRRLKKRLQNVNLYITKLKQRTVRIAAFSTGAVLNFTQAEIKNLIVEKDCHFILDLRDNQSIYNVHIHENFAGNVNLSRNSVEKIRIDNNCRCDLSLYDSLRCCDIDIGDVFSGNFDIKNSCFHRLKIGYYCYAVINLNGNWGRKDIQIGNSFRGNLSIDTVHVPNVAIGNDCKGKIVVSSQNQERGSRHIDIADDFRGELDISGSQTVERIDVGNNVYGRFNLQGCSAIKVAWFEKGFHGYADFSGSNVEYIQAKEGCTGEMVLFNCANLALLKLPNERQANISIERNPVNVENDGKHVFHHFHLKDLPKEYFLPFEQRWADKIKNFFAKRA